LRRISSLSLFVSLGSSSRISDVLMLGNITKIGRFVRQNLRRVRFHAELLPLERGRARVNCRPRKSPWPGCSTSRRSPRR
jgi:hypothetical protein